MNNLDQLDLALYRINENRCPNCGNKLKKVTDSRTKKKSNYLFHCDKCMKDNIIMSKG